MLECRGRSVADHGRPGGQVWQVAMFVERARRLREIGNQLARYTTRPREVFGVRIGGTGTTAPET